MAKEIVYVPSVIERQIKILKEQGYTDHQILIEEHDGFMRAVAKNEKPLSHQVDQEKSE